MSVRSSGFLFLLWRMLRIGDDRIALCFDHEQKVRNRRVAVANEVKIKPSVACVSPRPLAQRSVMLWQTSLQHWLGSAASCCNFAFIVSRAQKAVELLENAGLGDGCFLVRMSKRNPGQHVLTMSFEKTVYNYEIKNKVSATLRFLSVCLNFFRNFKCLLQVFEKFKPLKRVFHCCFDWSKLD